MIWAATLAPECTGIKMELEMVEIESCLSIARDSRHASDLCLLHLGGSLWVFRSPQNSRTARTHWQ